MTEQQTDGPEDLAGNGPGGGHHDTDERFYPGGTPSPGSRDLTAKPSSPGEQDTSRPTAVPGSYDADDPTPATTPGG